MKGGILSFRDLKVYLVAAELAYSIFVESKKWPKEEMYALTDQVRYSSRAIGAAIAEAWGKRRYPAHFISKLTDADAELQETLHWITCSLKCSYISENVALKWEEKVAEIGKM